MANFFSKIFREFKRIDEDFLGILGLSPQKLPDIPPPPPPEPPIAIPETGEAEVTKRRKLIQGGKGRTILAGQLTPTKTGKRRILG